ncbi:Homoserine O-acetyltransferase [Streptomyces alboniger]
MSDHLTFQLGDFTTQHGATLRGATLAYTTYGELNADKSNVIVYPTWYSGRHWDNEWLIGSGMALDPAEYFIIVPNMLGNGLSTSPSNTPPPYDRARFPHITVYDQIEAQHKLVTEEFGIEKIALVTGWSMGAGQTFQWAVSYPEMVERIAPFCGSPRTSLHNKVFLEGVKAALTADAVYNGGWYDAEKWPTTGLRALARVYAGWGFSQAFYWEKEYEKLGYTSWRISSSASGRASSSTDATPTTCSPCSGPGRTATSGSPPASTGTRRRRSAPSRRPRSTCPPRRTSTSSRRTRPGPSVTYPAPSSA